MTIQGAAAQMSRAQALLASALEQLDESQTAYDAGWADCEKAARAQAPAAIDTPQELCRRLAGWIDANQLPVDGPHAAESATRRRLVVLLRDLAEQDHVNYTAAADSLNATATATAP